MRNIILLCFCSVLLFCVESRGQFSDYSKVATPESLIFLDIHDSPRLIRSLFRNYYDARFRHAIKAGNLQPLHLPTPISEVLHRQGEDYHWLKDAFSSSLHQKNLLGECAQSLNEVLSDNQFSNEKFLDCLCRLFPGRVTIWIQPTNGSFSLQFSIEFDANNFDWRDYFASFTTKGRATVRKILDYEIWEIPSEKMGVLCTDRELFGIVGLESGEREQALMKMVNEARSENSLSRNRGFQRVAKAISKQESKIDVAVFLNLEGLRRLRSGLKKTESCFSVCGIFACLEKDDRLRFGVSYPLVEPLPANTVEFLAGMGELDINFERTIPTSATVVSFAAPTSALLSQQLNVPSDFPGREFFPDYWGKGKKESILMPSSTPLGSIFKKAIAQNYSIQQEVCRFDGVHFVDGTEFFEPRFANSDSKMVVGFSRPKKIGTSFDDKMSDVLGGDQGKARQVKSVDQFQLRHFGKGQPKITLLDGESFEMLLARDEVPDQIDNDSLASWLKKNRFGRFKLSELIEKPDIGRLKGIVLRSESGAHEYQSIALQPVFRELAAIERTFNHLGHGYKAIRLGDMTFSYDSKSLAAGFENRVTILSKLFNVLSSSFDCELDKIYRLKYMPLVNQKTFWVEAFFHDETTNLIQYAGILHYFK
jgi:hypothetical protein